MTLAAVSALHLRHGRASGWRHLEDEGEGDDVAFQLEYILLLSLLVCLFWWPCVKLIPVIIKYIKSGVDLIRDFWQSLTSNEPPPPPIPPVERKTFKKNKKGHISDKPPALFFEDD
jgi:hypothetical protein